MLKNIVVTKENASTFKDLKKCGNIEIKEGAVLDMPKLQECGDVYLYPSAQFTAPVLATCGYVRLDPSAQFTAPVLATCGYVRLDQSAQFTAPVLATCGYVCLYPSAQFTAPVLATCGYVRLYQSAQFTAPVLATCGYVRLYPSAQFTAPVLATCGYVYLDPSAQFTAPVLATCGDVYLYQSAQFTAPVLATCGYVRLYQSAQFTAPVTKHLNYKSVDGTMFVIESEKISKGIKILSGYILEKIIDNKIQRKICFVAEKESFYAHGETVKSAINDLQFKIVAEKLKSDPIKEDTEFTVMYYRTLTGACDLGCRQWLEQNNIPFKVENNKTVELKPMKAKELLPILEKSRPYGFDKFKSLLTF